MVNMELIGADIIDLLDNKGAFFITGNKDKLNVMNIGWGTIGYFWSKPTFIAAIRPSRYTYQFLKEKAEFNVCFTKGALNKQLVMVGTKSGRDIDKRNIEGITYIDSKTNSTPVIEEADFTIECKVLYTQPLDPNALPEDVKKTFYGGSDPKDVHTMFYAEITAMY